VLLLVDALDEVATADLRAAAVAKLLSFHDSYPRCRVLLTARDYSYIHRTPGIERLRHYRLSPVSVNQLTRMVDHFARARSVPSETAKEMLRRLEHVHGMALSPLLVAVFLSSADFARKDIPPNITELFSKFTELMLGRWDSRKGLAQQYQASVKDFLLSQIALTMHNERVTEIPLERCQTLIGEELEKRGYVADVDTLFEEAVYRSGLLRVEDDRVRFRHHLLQEYFAGKGASLDHLRRVVHDEWWRSPIVFYFGHNPGRVDELSALAAEARSRPPAELYEAAATIGLAVQACYLTTTSDKVGMLAWVVSSLASCADGYLAAGDADSKFPLVGFLTYYIIARDSVACDPIAEVSEKRPSPDQLPLAEAADRKLSELFEFWCIVGLIESGNLETAEARVKHFRPTDERLLLALHLGCYLITKLRFSTASQKHAARRICDRVEPKVGHMFDQVTKEMRGVLLEVREGEIRAIDAEAGSDLPSESSSGANA